MKGYNHRPARLCVTHRQAGLTLVELMIALAIGAFLMIGAVSVFVNSRDAQRTSDTLARMTEAQRARDRELVDEMRQLYRDTAERQDANLRVTLEPAKEAAKRTDGNQTIIK